MMNHFAEKYISPFTDYGFKRLFGEEANKDLLLDFLNEVLREEAGEIKSIQYVKSEQLGRTSEDRMAIFDIFCENEQGEKFIVEMQKTRQRYFKDRSVYYATFPIQQQAQKNEWNYGLKSVYIIAILDFVFEEDRQDLDKYRYDIKLTDIDTHKVFYDKLTFIYFEMPKFNKPIEDLGNKYEKWLYVLKNLPRLQEYPVRLQEKIFEKVFSVAEIARFTRDEYFSYEESLKVYRDNKNAMDTAVEEAKEKAEKKGRAEGRAEGRKEEKVEIARNMLNVGLGEEIICQATGLSLEELERLKTELKKH